MVKINFKHTHHTISHTSTSFLCPFDLFLLVLFSYDTFCLFVKLYFSYFKQVFWISIVFSIVNVKSFDCFIHHIHYVCIYCHQNCQINVFKCIFNDTLTLQQTSYYLNIYSTFNVYNRGRNRIQIQIQIYRHIYIYIYIYIYNQQSNKQPT